MRKASTLSAEQRYALAGALGLDPSTATDAEIDEVKTECCKHAGIKDLFVHCASYGCVYCYADVEDDGLCKFCDKQLQPDEMYVKRFAPGDMVEGEALKAEITVEMSQTTISIDDKDTEDRL